MVLILQALNNAAGRPVAGGSGLKSWGRTYQAEGVD
jgi:hypothetical protein